MIRLPSFPVTVFPFSTSAMPFFSVRTKSASDEAVPNANGTMITNLVALSLLTGDVAHLDRAQALSDGFGNDIKANLISHGGVLAASFDLLSPQQIVVMHDGASADAGDMISMMRRISLPGVVQSVIVDTTQIAKQSPLFGKTVRDGKPTGYFCAGRSCSAPIMDGGELIAHLKEARRIKV